MTRIICVASGKGGVGKTTLVSNLGAALANMGRDVVVVDTNLTTPNLGLHLGIPLYPVTLHDVLKGRNSIKDAIYEHESGIKIVPAGISLKDLRGTDARDLPNSLLDMLGNNEIIILDAAAGLGKEALAAMESADEMIIVTSPELPSVTDALKAIKLAQQLGAKISGVVVNRVTQKKHEMSMEEISNMLEVPIIAIIPEDESVRESIANRMPVVSHKPKSKASNAINDLAAELVGERVERPWYKSLFLFRR